MKIIIAIKHTGSPSLDRWTLQQALSEVQTHHDPVSRPTICVVTLSTSPFLDISSYEGLAVDDWINLSTTDSLDAMHICELLLPVVNTKTPDLVVLSPELCSMTQQTGKLLATLLYQQGLPNSAPFNRKHMRALVIREIHSGAHTVLLPDLSHQAARDVLLINNQIHCASGYMSV